MEMCTIHKSIKIEKWKAVEMNKCIKVSKAKLLLVISVTVGKGCSACIIMYIISLANIPVKLNTFLSTIAEDI